MTLQTAPFDRSLLKDDTEEDLVGSDLHQDAIRLLAENLRYIAAQRDAPWHVSSQLMILMGPISGRPWHPSPDIFVHLTAGPDPLESFDATSLGVPRFVVEVTSPATWRYDTEGKRRGYELVGVGEYLVFDPTGDLLGDQVRAWRATAGGFTPWGADRDGTWRSDALDLAFRPEGVLLRTIDRDGELVPSASEALRLAHAAARRADEAARRADELEAELRKLRGQDD